MKIGDFIVKREDLSQKQFDIWKIVAKVSISKVYCWKLQLYVANIDPSCTRSHFPGLVFNVPIEIIQKEYVLYNEKTEILYE
ncbi:MAG: hypothetical protein RIR48_1079 [Bacteroidota bacterium]|jgi:hypothetical protein